MVISYDNVSIQNTPLKKGTKNDIKRLNDKRYNDKKKNDPMHLKYYYILYDENNDFTKTLSIPFW